MTATSRPTSANALNDLQNVPGHGFTGGEIVIFDGAWVLASADSLANCTGAMIVSIVPSADSFYVSQIGDVGPFASPPGPFAPGVLYYLDPNPLNAGKLTTVKPSVAGQVIFPCFIAKDASNGFFFSGAGQLIEPPLAFQYVTVTTDTLMQTNTAYIINGGVPLNMTLPPNFVAGDTILIRGANGAGWIVKQNAGQDILYNGTNTTVGTGELQSTANWNCVTLEAVTTNTQMQVTGNTGILNAI